MPTTAIHSRAGASSRSTTRYSRTTTAASFSSGPTATSTSRPGTAAAAATPWGAARTATRCWASCCASTRAESGTGRTRSRPTIPFVGAAGTRPEIWAYGLRNPWRFSFDRLTGDLAMGDVGQALREEVDFQPRGQGAGANYGWKVCEGDLAYPSQDPCPANPAPAYAPPVLTYGRGSGICGSGPAQSSITGGFVVRDASIPSLVGRYVYADFCRGFMRSAVLALGSASGDGDLGVSVTGVGSFGEDALCRLYVASPVSGLVYRLEAQTPGAPGCQTAPLGTFPHTSPLPSPSRGPLPPAFSAQVDVTAPELTDLSLTRRRFAVGKAQTALTAAVLGTAFRFVLSDAATVRIAIALRLTGRWAAGRCQAATRRLRSRARCTRYVERATLARTLGAGRRSIAFWTGRATPARRRELPRDPHGRRRRRQRLARATGQLRHHRLR